MVMLRVDVAVLTAWSFPLIPVWLVTQHVCISLSFDKFSNLHMLYIDPRPSRQSRDAPVSIRGRTRYPDGSSQLETRCRSESHRQTEGFGPSVTHGWATPVKMRKKCCYGRDRNLGRYSSLSLSPTHNKHHPFENKVWEIYFFIKKCVRSFIEIRHYCWICFRLYLYMYMYAAIQQHVLFIVYQTLGVI